MADPVLVTVIVLVPAGVANGVGGGGGGPDPPPQLLTPTSAQRIKTSRTAPPGGRRLRAPASTKSPSANGATLHRRAFRWLFLAAVSNCACGPVVLIVSTVNPGDTAPTVVTGGAKEQLARAGKLLQENCKAPMNPSTEVVVMAKLTDCPAETVADCLSTESE